MAQTQSNLLYPPLRLTPSANTGVQTTTPALSAALNNKINPSPLPPIKTTTTPSPLPPIKTTTTPTTSTIQPTTSNNSALLGQISNLAGNIQTGLSNLSTQNNTNTALKGGTGQMEGRGQQGGLTGTFSGGQFTPDANQPSPEVGKTFGGLIGTLANAAQTGSPAIGGIISSLSGLGGLNPAVAQATKNLQDFQNKYAQAQAQIDLEPTDIAFKQGEQQVLGRQAAAQQAALQTAVQNALAGQGQQVTALGTAGGLANTAQQLQQQGLGTAAGYAQPSLGSYGQTYYSPLQTGQGAGQIIAGGDFDSALNQYAQMAANGQLSQVPSSITSNAVLNAELNRRAKIINPNYNPVLSQSSAQTQATGQQASAAAPAAYQALDALQTAFNNLGPTTGGTSIPLLNQIEQGFGFATGIGRQQISAYQGALKEARAQLDAVLAPIIGVDAASLQANALLPDNMIPSEIPQKIQAAKTYVQQRIQSYVGSGGTAGQTPSTTGGTGSQYDW